MFCGKCGAQISEGAKFCGVCGAAVEAPAAEAPAVEMPQAPVMETPVMEAPVMEAPVTQTLVAEAPDLDVPTGDEDTKKKGNGKKIAILAACAVAAVAVVAGIVLLVSNLLGGKGSQAFFYTDQKGRLQFMANAKESTEPQNLGSIEPGTIQCSEDGKTWYIWDSDNTLYTITSAAAKKGDRPQRVSKDVQTYTAMANGKAVYLELKNGKHTLNCYDGKDSFKLAKDVTFDLYGTSFTLSEDEKSVYYLTRSESDGYDLYNVSIKDGAEPKLLVEGAARFKSSYDADVLLFTKKDADASADAGTLDTSGHVSYDVYSCTPGGEPELLVKGVSYVYGTSADEFYYTRAVGSSHKLYDFVTDRLAGTDAALLDQELTEPDWYDEYYPETTWMMDGAWYYTDRAGENHPVDISDLGYTSAEDIPQYWAEDAAWDTARAAYNEAYEAYWDAWEQRYEAEQREEVRQQLQEKSYDQVSYNLYHYAGSGEGSALATNVTNVSSSGIRNVVFFHKAEAHDAGKVVNMEDLYYWDEIYSYLDSGSSDGGDSAWYAMVGESECLCDGLDMDAHFTCYVMGDNELVLLTRDKSRLESWIVEGDALRYADTLASNVSTYNMWEEDDALYFFADVSNSMGTLCRYRDGEVTELSDNVYSAYIFPESGTIFARVDRAGDESFTLLQIDRKGKTEEIADEVGSLWVIDEDTALYKSDGDLYCWGGKDTYRVARNATNVYTFPNAGFRMSTSSYGYFY